MFAHVAQAIGLAVFAFLAVAMVVGQLTSEPRDDQVDPAVAAEVRERIAQLRGENHQRQRP